MDLPFSFGDLDLCLPLCQAKLICDMRFVWSRCQGQEALPSRTYLCCSGSHSEHWPPTAALLQFCTTSRVMLELLIWLVYLQPCALPSFFLPFLFLWGVRERGVKWRGKMLIAGITKKLLKEKEIHVCEGWCKCVDWIMTCHFIMVIIIAAYVTSNKGFLRGLQL